MADNHFAATVDPLFRGMDQFVTTKTVVGEAVKIDDAIILPLVDVTCGISSGFFCNNPRERRRRYERQNEPQRCACDSERRYQTG